MNRAHQNLVILSWNVRGLGQQEKFDVMRDALVQAHPSILCLQETKLHSITAQKCKAFLSQSLDSFHLVPASGSRGGILTAWSSSSFILHDFIERLLTLKIGMT